MEVTHAHLAFPIEVAIDRTYLLEHAVQVVKHRVRATQVADETTLTTTP